MAVTNPLLKALRRQKAQQGYSPDDEEDFGESLAESQPGMAAKLGYGTLSLVGAIGNALALPGSMVRDTISGENPFDQLLTPFSDENRVSGRDLLRRNGMVGQEDTWGNWAGGMAAEMLLDPTTYVGGLGALSKAGTAAKATGLFDDAIKAATKRVGPKMGRWEGSMVATLNDALASGSKEAATKLGDYAIKNRLSDEALEALKAKPLGGLTGWSIPFTGQYGAWGTGKLSQGIGRGIDTVESIVGRSAPGRFAKMLFNAPSGGHYGVEEQALAEAAHPMVQSGGYRAKESAMQADDVMRQTFGRYASELFPAGFADDAAKTDAFNQYDRLVRMTRETGDAAHAWQAIAGTPASPEALNAIKQAADHLQAAKNAPFERALQMGIKVSTLNGSHSPDDLIGEFPDELAHQASHSPRYGGDAEATGGDWLGREHKVRSPLTQARDNAIREIPAEIVNQMLKDAELRGKPSDALDAVMRKYGAYIKPPDVLDPATKSMVRQDTSEFAKQIVDFVQSHKEGDLFTRSNLDDNTKYINAMERMASTGDAIHDYLNSKIVAPGPGTVPISKAFADIGLDAGRAAEELAGRYGTSAADILTKHVPADSVTAATKVLHKVQNPEWFSVAGKMWDSVTKVLKTSLTTPWPAFWSRNRLGGIASNAMSGHIRTLGDIRDYTYAEWKALRLARGLGIGPLSGLGEQRKRVAEEAAKTFGKKAEQFMPVMDAHAQWWAEQTGKQADEWYGRVTMRQGDESMVGRGALPQGWTSDDQLVKAWDKYISATAALSNKKHTQPDLRLRGAKEKYEKEIADLQAEVTAAERGLRDVPGMQKEVDRALRNHGSEYVADYRRWEEDHFGQDFAEQRAKQNLLSWIKSQLLDGYDYRAQEQTFGRKLETLLREHPEHWDFAWDRLMNYRNELERGSAGLTPDGKAIPSDIRAGHTESFLSDLSQDIEKAIEDGVYGELSSDYLFQSTPIHHAKGAVEFFGRTDPQAVITAFKSADISTLVHEVAHVFERSLQEASPDLYRQAGEALGIAANQDWTTEAKEKFARGFERYMRDGSAPNSMLKDAFDKFKDWLTKIYQSLVGTPIEQAVNPKLRDVFDRMLTPAHSSDVLRQAKQYDLIGSYGLDDAALSLTADGVRPANPFNGKAALARAAKEVTTGPFKRTRTAIETVNQTGKAANAQVEFANRMSMFIYLQEKGWSPEEAAKETKRLHASGEHTDFERNVMKRLFPFYSFSRHNAPVVLQTLAQQPGGPMAQVVKNSDSNEKGEIVPDHIAGTAAIPMGTLPDGSDRYFTGFGFPHEDTLSFGAAPGAGFLRAAGLEGLSRLHPVIKGPLEWATGSSFFQKGPGGGRPIDDLDPTIGRTVANLTGAEQPLTGPGSQLIENVVANSPLSRAATTARTLSDPRKGMGAKAINLLTGMRVTDVSPSSQETVLREQVEHLTKQMPGARQFTRTFIPKDVMARMEPQEREIAQSYQNVLKQLAERAKKRAEKKKQEASK